MASGSNNPNPNQNNPNLPGFAQFAYHPNFLAEWLLNQQAATSPQSTSTHSSHNSPMVMPTYGQLQQMFMQQFPSTQLPQQESYHPEMPTQAPNEEIEEEEAEAEDEEDQELNEDDLDNKRRRQGKAPAKAKTTMKWKKDDELILAECWVAISEDNVVGRNQTSNQFYSRVRDLFNPRVSTNRARGRDQLSGKWRSLAKDVKKFDSFYNQAVRLRKSGESDNDVEKRLVSGSMGIGALRFILTIVGHF